MQNLVSIMLAISLIVSDASFALAIDARSSALAPPLATSDGPRIITNPDGTYRITPVKSMDFFKGDWLFENIARIVGQMLVITRDRNLQEPAAILGPILADYIKSMNGEEAAKQQGITPGKIFENRTGGKVSGFRIPVSRHQDSGRFRCNLEYSLTCEKPDCVIPIGDGNAVYVNITDAPRLRIFQEDAPKREIYHDMSDKKGPGPSFEKVLERGARPLLAAADVAPAARSPKPVDRSTLLSIYFDDEKLDPAVMRRVMLLSDEELAELNLADACELIAGNTLYTLQEQREIISVLKSLYRDALPYFRRGVVSNPVHHNTQVLYNMVRIAIGEKVSYGKLVSLAVFALLHDIGNAVSMNRKIQDFQVSEAVQLASREADLVKKAELRSAAQGLAHSALEFRMEHMHNAPSIIHSLMAPYVDSGVLSSKEVDNICRADEMHDYPSIEKYMNDLRSKGIETKHVKGAFLLPFGDPEIGMLVTCIREADRLFMLSVQGVIKDLQYGNLERARKGDPQIEINSESMARQAADNIKTHKDEYRFYRDAGKDDGGFINNESLYRTQTGYSMFRAAKARFASTDRRVAASTPLTAYDVAQTEEFLLDYRRDPSLGRQERVAIVVKSTDQITRNARHLQRLQNRVTIGGRTEPKGPEAGIVLLTGLDIDSVSPGSEEQRIDLEEPTGMDVWGPQMAFASWDKVVIYDFMAQKTKVIRNDWFGNLHTVVFSGDGKKVLATSPGFEMIMEIDIETGAVVWEWCAWEHGYSISKSGKYFYTRDKAFKDQKAYQGKEVVLVDDPPRYKGYGIPTGNRSAHLNGAIYGSDGSILATLYHPGKVVRIDKSTGNAAEIYSDLKSPHGLRGDGDGYFVTSTTGRDAHVAFLDHGFKPVRKLSPVGMPGTRENFPETLEWLQYATKIAENLYAVVDIHRSSIYLVDPRARAYRVIHIPKEWSVQMVVPVPNNMRLLDPSLLQAVEGAGEPAPAGAQSGDAVSEQQTAYSKQGEGTQNANRITHNAERIHAIHLRDAVSFLQAKLERKARKTNTAPQPVIFALGTSWIKGYDKEKHSEYHNMLNPLLTAIKTDCESKGITVLIDKDGNLPALIEAEKAKKGMRGAKVVVLAGARAARSKAYQGLRWNRKFVFVVGVDSRELTVDSYIRIPEMMEWALKMAFKNVFGRTAVRGTPDVSIVFDRKFHIMIFVPLAKRYKPEELAEIYKVLRFA